MASDDDLHELQTQINHAREEYAKAVGHLRSVAPKYTHFENLVEHAEEFGPDHTIILMHSSPARFGLQNEPTEKEQLAVADALHKLMKVTDTLDLHTSHREDILSAKNPSRQRVYALEARECVFDDKTKTLTFLDSPNRSYRISPVTTDERAPVRELVDMLTKDNKPTRGRGR